MALGVARLAGPVFRLRRQGWKGLIRQRGKPQPGKDGSNSRSDNREAKSPDAAARSSDTEPQGIKSGLWVSSAIETIIATKPPTIVVPVYGALSELKACIGSVVRNTYGDVKLLIIDDASPQPEVGDYLRDLARRYCNIELEVNESNLGFVRTANKAFEMTDGDVVLLNSDTQVPPRWLNRLRLIAYSDPTVGTVTPLSDNAGAFSAPSIDEANEMPLGVDSMGRLVTQESGFRMPSTPTANGFCMYLKREVISATGGFDAESFPRGYGEENDLSMRSMAMGWRHVVDDSTLVFHSRSSSFQEEKADLLARGKAKMLQLHPEYGREVKAFIADKAMQGARQAVQRAVDSAQTGKRGLPRILYVVHGGGGGTIMTNLDLMHGVSEEYQPLLLSTRGESIRLYNGIDNELLRRITLKDRIQPGDFESAEYRDVVGGLIASYGVEIVHIRHLQRHTFDLPSIAKSLDLPVLLSFHDFYYCCPTVHLLDERDQFCGGICTPGQGQCRTPRWFIGTPHLKHGWVKVWQQRSSEMFKNVDVFVTTSPSAVSVYREVFPELREARFEVIEHGRDLDQQASLAEFPSPGQPARVLLLGHVEVHKGAGLVADLQRLDRERQALEFHLLGNLTDEVTLDVVDHGTYRREELAQRLAEIRPAAVALLTIWPETYSHTLTEAWSAGIPVVASRLGALGERIDRHGGGWALDISNPEQIYEFLLNLFSDRDRWEAERGKARVAGFRSVNEMSSDYLRLYNELMDQHRSFSPVNV
jgi:GT2 family glycosyltransferase/glycosyltransferase involved in cell wall biosynthesis